MCLTDGGKSKCYAPLTVAYTAHERNATVAATAWSLRLRNQEPSTGEAFSLNHLKVRYYFDRSGVAEPMLTHGMQASLKLASGENPEIASPTWSIQRTEDVPDGVYDAYVEVGFGSSPHTSAPL